MAAGACATTGGAITMAARAAAGNGIAAGCKAFSACCGAAGRLSTLIACAAIIYLTVLIGSLIKFVLIE
jgi:hypothetical protein